MQPKKNSVQLQAELSNAIAQINLLTQQLAQRDAEYIELKAMYAVALEDIKRLMEENARLNPQIQEPRNLPVLGVTTNVFNQLITEMGIECTNALWQNVKCEKHGEVFRVWFTPEVYRANRAVCIDLLKRLTTKVIAAGYNATPRGSYLAISKKTS